MDAASPRVVVALMGLPGAGKTTLAEALAPRMPARIVSRDVIRAAMFKPCSFTEAEKAAAFRALVDAVAVNCRLGHSSIVDGMPFSREGELEAVAAAVVQQGCRTLPVLCAVPVEEAMRRVEQQQGHAARDRGDERVREVAERFRAIPDGALRLDATRPTGELVQAVLDRIGATG